MQASRDTEEAGENSASNPSGDDAATPEKAPDTPRRRGWLEQQFRLHVRPIFSKRLSALAAAVVPALYMAYMRFVFVTSRIEPNDFLALKRANEEFNGAVALLWHEEVMTVAYGYFYLGFRGHTLASVGDAGELIARILQRCNFVVFRGGSTKGRARRREGVLQEMIDHMRTHDQVIYGLTVDGSRGPRYHLKHGGIVIARECNKPILLVRTWYKRYLRLPTWDRMAVPLPFNRIGYYIKGPYFVPEGTHSAAGLEEFRLALENDLIDLAAESYADMGHPRPTELCHRAQSLPATANPAEALR